MSKRRVNDKETLSTCQIAELFDVCSKTVGKWMKTGLLPSYRLPGPRGHRRATREAVVNLMMTMGMPVPESLLSANP